MAGAAAILGAPAAPAWQGALPLAPLGLPALPAGRPLDPLVAPLQDALASTRTQAEEARSDLRRRATRVLLAQHRRELEADPAGNPVVRSELLVYAPDAGTLAAAQAAGFSLLEQRMLPGLDALLVRLGAPAGMATRQALVRLRALAPQAAVDYNHLLQPTAATAPATGALGGPATGAGQGGTSAPSPTASIGLIDSGVDLGHPALSGHGSTQAGCALGALPTPHGTAVASLLAGLDGRFRGAAPGARLVIVDVYCNAATGGSTDQVAAAFALLAGAGVPVINVSLVGPYNSVLAAVVAATLRRGILVVAATGNDGPAAPPLYPASLPGVVAVTAIDRRGQLLPEASRSPQLAFAAPGAGLRAAGVPQGYVTVRGTSFAAPLVAGLLAGALSAAGPAGTDAVERLAAGIPAERRGDPHRFGHGIVGLGFLDPEATPAPR
jgi:subtilisin family serine protease